MSEIIFDRLAALADCLCNTVRDEGLPGYCFCGVVPGEAMADIYATEDCLTEPTDEANGYGWVRMTLAYPADSVGVQKAVVGNCDSGLGLDVEVGSMRCYPINADGTGPSKKELLDLTALQVLDMMAMRKAVSCCFAPGEVGLQTYLPYGPQGGQFGGTWTLSISGDF